MIPVVIQLGPLPIHSFGLMMLLCFFAAYRRLALSLERAGERPELAEPMITWAAVGGILGARINYLVSFPEEVIERGIWAVVGGAGFVFYGGFIGGVLGVWLVLRKNRADFLRYGDLSGAALALGYAVGRIGCHLSGDGDYGGPSTVPWAVSYAHGVMPTDPGVLVHPSPIYETFGSLAIAAILVSLEGTRTLAGKGQRFGLYLLLSALARFLVEYVRIEPIVWNGFTQAQVMALCVAPVGFFLLAFPRRSVEEQPITERP